MGAEEAGFVFLPVVPVKAEEDAMVFREGVVDAADVGPVGFEGFVRDEEVLAEIGGSGLVGGGKCGEHLLGDGVEKRGGDDVAGDGLALEAATGDGGGGAGIVDLVIGV